MGIVELFDDIILFLLMILLFGKALFAPPFFLQFPIVITSFSNMSQQASSASIIDGISTACRLTETTYVIIQSSGGD